MKKRFLLTIGLIVLSMQAAIAQKAIAMLNHNDTVTVFSNDQLQDAIDKAVAGDIIYLSEGLFPAFKVGRNNITIIGAGKGTVIPGTITIRCNSNSVKLSNMQISGIKFNNYSDKSGAIIAGTKITQCLVGDIDMTYKYGWDTYKNIEIVMSQITGILSIGSPVESLTVSNTKIKTLSGSGASYSSAKFINCNIPSLGRRTESNDQNSYQNCIIGTINYGIFANCLYKDGSVGTLTDCNQDKDFSFDDDMNCSLSETQLRTKGYLGTDGTIVGVDGGGTPFTLASPLLQVVEHEIEVDNKNKRLRVTLNLGNK